MTDISQSKYYMPFPTGPVVDNNRNMTVTFQRFMLSLFNRTGKEQGVDSLYDEQQTGVAIEKADQAETDARGAQAMAQAAQATASTAQATAAAAIATANEAEADAQSALKAAEDVLIRTLLTSSAQVAKTAQSLDDAALMAAQSQTWPSQLLQSSQA
ncbi:hypothetical protein JK208_05405 [Gluconobacter sp. Dm-74]|uniref:hypothetical protein n=1 Tax=Gluconobacter sp. Dm-74 TaxID=2799803 RepID=UPI001B8D3D9D|nr:hypothetical protein [Gluconobacter sp. Dm-74]MBS1091042.1 hypothetical protein [Gluconobacter sp. Dm-74]